MAVAFYFDHNVSRRIADGLRLRGVDVLTAFEDGRHEAPDPKLLDRAQQLGRVVFTGDDDFLAEATRRQRSGEPFHGVVYSHMLRVGIGQCIDDLELLAGATRAEEWTNSVVFLPLT